jgi:hypothetical protein
VTFTITVTAITLIAVSLPSASPSPPTVGCKARVAKLGATASPTAFPPLRCYTVTVPLTAVATQAVSEVEAVGLPTTLSHSPC